MDIELEDGRILSLEDHGGLLVCTLYDENGEVEDMEDVNAEILLDAIFGK